MRFTHLRYDMFARALIIHIAALSLAGCWSFSPVNGFCQLSKISSCSWPPLQLRQILAINSTFNRYMLLLSRQGISGHRETLVAYFFECSSPLFWHKSQKMSIRILALLQIEPRYRWHDWIYVSKTWRRLAWRFALYAGTGLWVKRRERCPT